MLKTLQDRKFSETLLIVVDLSKEDEELMLNFDNAMKVQKSVISLLNGEISPDDYLDLVESSVPCMDNYVDEICENIKFFLENDLCG